MLYACRQERTVRWVYSQCLFLSHTHTQRRTKKKKEPNPQKKDPPSSRCTRPVPRFPTRTNIDHEADAGPDGRVPALKAKLRRDAILRHDRGSVRDEHRLEDGVRSSRGAHQDDGAGTPGGFDGELGGAVVAFELEGVGGGEEPVEGRVAVGRGDGAGVRVPSKAGVWDVAGGV